ncbi:PAS/PAC sensor signal transduction histidine kinase [Rhodopirellula sp. SWK7]|nr:PAS/PAC sensor signal transduction histidine kinase [Rhodopirellula sp. SWK7]
MANEPIGTETASRYNSMTVRAFSHGYSFATIPTAPMNSPPNETNSRVDDRAKQAAQHQAAMEEVRGQYEELAELAGSLAHEIKNPLSIIHMNIELLSEDLVEIDTPGSRRCLPRVDMVRAQCERMEALLRDFLRYARLRHIDLIPGSLNDQVRQVLNAYQAQADSQKVDLQRYLDPDLPSIRLHSDSLQSALMNLVKNALEAMPDGGQLWARTYSNRGGVGLDLIDTGGGLDDNTVLHMFEPFYSTKDGGSGLGLPTARKIIEAHGGRISVQSELNRGTKFSLQFPVPPRLQ